MTNRVKKIFIAVSAPLLIIIACICVVAIYANFHKPQEVDILPTGFTTQKLEINEGETIHFVNRSPSVVQFLCLGSNMHCDSFAFQSVQLPPPELKSPGVRIAPQQAQDILFDTDGTFQITSTVVPGVNLTVTVEAAG